MRRPQVTPGAGIGLIEPDQTTGVTKISEGNTSAILKIHDDIITVLEKMSLKNDLVTQLESFSDLPADWAGDETHMPSKSTITSAMTLLSSLSSDHVLPQVSPSADGEIGFTWLTDGLRVEALLYPDNHLVWLWTSDGNVNPGGEGSFDGSFPDGLLDKIATAAV